MCGRFNISNKITPIVSMLFDTQFSVVTNENFSPSQSASTITTSENGFQQVNANWGIKPNWSKKLIINAQSETVAAKPTFRQSFILQRCLVPCNGWYEWRTEEGKKIKYFFEHFNKLPLYMAGILFKHEITELVTLTTAPSKTCALYHKRMPVLISPENKDDWFSSSTEQLGLLMSSVNDEMINVKRSE
ncbi:MAG: SOS response-associated peptidase [Colwellia sp.]|nr:SOS response-associated peptidase [Colwellia sp.]